MDGEIYSWGFADPGVLGHEDCSDDVLRPKKLNVVSKVNKIRTKRGKTPMTADVHKVSSGGQHSAIICTLVE
jgi:alpha-tubulin suppressor-like RCC1 family protein